MQATTATDHAIKIKGLEDVQTSLKPNVSGMKHLRPSIKKKMTVLFIVPDTLRMIFVKQTIEGAKQATKKGAKKGTKKETEPLWCSVFFRYQKKRCSKQRSHDSNNNVTVFSKI